MAHEAIKVLKKFQLDLTWNFQLQVDTLDQKNEKGSDWNLNLKIVFLKDVEVKFSVKNGSQLWIERFLSKITKYVPKNMDHLIMVINKILIIS
jgi:hypothetical protein